MGIEEKYNEQKVGLEKAIIDFKKSLDADMNKYDDLEQNWIKNAQIQKFEFCIELLWKTTKTYFEIQGEYFLTPKQNIKELFLHKLVDEGLYLNLMACIDDRNKLSHIYKLEMFDQMANNIPLHYSAIEAAKNCLIKII